MTEQNKKNPSAGTNHISFPDPAQLREQAEQKARAIDLPNPDTMTHEEIRQMIYEMQVKQIEAGLENEQLRSGRKEYDDRLALLTTIIETMQDMVYLADPDGNITFAGKSVEILGYSRDFLVGKNIMDFVHPEDLDRVLEGYNELVAGLEPHRTPFRCRCKDGSYRWIETRGTFLKDEKGNPHKIVLNSRDITERRQSEIYRGIGQEILQILNEPGDLQESIQSVIATLKTRTGFDAVGLRLQEGEDFPYFAQEGFPADFLLTEITLVERGKDGGVCRDKDGNVHLECTCGLVISGKTDPSNPLFTKEGSSWTNDASLFLDLPSDQDPRLNPRNNCIHQGYASVALIPIRSRDRIVGLIQLNDKRKDRFTLETIEFLEGIAAHIGSALMRKQAEQALAESETRYKALHNASFGGLAIHDQGFILECNHGLSEMTGYRYSELIGMDGLLLIAERSREAVMNNIRTGYEKPYEAFGLRKNGEEFPLQLEARNVPYKGKQVRAVEFRDFTERKKTVQERDKLQAQLHQAQKMESVGRLAGGVAHDFNNKLTIINGYSEIAIDMMDPSDPLHETIREIHTAGKQSAAIVGQLLAFARKQTISPVQLDLNDTISNMLKMLHRLIGENIDLAWSPGKNLWTVNIDPSQVDQIMTNIAVNSRDAIPDVGKITIETENIEFDEQYCADHAGFVPGQFVMLAVSDNGCGMDKHVKDNLFEPFFTTKEIGKGTGLGLATVYGIVKQNNGFVNVYSEPGQGTTIKTYLPRFKAESSFLKPAKETSGQIPGGTETILVVEDEKGVLQLSRRILDRLGYTLLIAENPSKALQLAGEYNGTIDLLITDVVMPDMNGRELSSQMTMIRPGLKTLYMSGYTANAIAHNGVLDEDVLFIQKPFSMQDLAAKVRKAIWQE